MVEKYPMTAVGKKELEEKLMYLKVEKQKELTNEIKQLRSFCHSSEDATFDDVFKKQSLLQNQIALIEDRLYHSELIEPKNETSPTVRIGSTVTFMELPDGEEENYTIVGALEVNPAEHKISIESPIGKSLLGSKVNDEVSIDIPSGEIRVKVVGIG
ncbi:transcription elongation factor GreA [Carnobacterium sp. TMP28]|uniref:transcription elongation factor GreA n=1 Tax=Carnobacterium sp. TMP28 TaxID=3397060 RepID=UPI0039E052C6